ncbi:hypothetical protein ATK36_1158 [Amycolatopsis sulphurea]|uniref:DNA-directed RNA polymerase specialized sigma24 family protein n=1 Tax=Amycolatopsis sulphurea TaxID=76022 RepID=A0A2A9G3Q3_9PSEU|nr:hypothetical protein [Amycolatopsis sulphurea]PFG57566.1 hypothetical protein ATK36_1158 [Amycolatopsis sulphurea]
MTQIDDADDRAEGDAALFEQLRVAGFSGPSWRLATREIAAYCQTVVGAWVETREIFRRCRRRGYVLRHQSLILGRPEIRDLVTDTVVDGLNMFRRRAMAGKGWRPGGGTSLASWVTDDCVEVFPNVWRRFLTATEPCRRLEAQALLTELEVLRPTAERSAEDRHLAVVAGADLLQHVKPAVRQAIELLALGYSQREACEIVGCALTPRALEGQLRRLRLRLRTAEEA